LLLVLFRSSVVGEFEGIKLADLRNAPEPFASLFLEALRLLRDTDTVRFRRVRRHIRWIVNCTLEDSSCASYNHGSRSCHVDFDPKEVNEDRRFAVGHWARVLVHEAAHAHVASHGIDYVPPLRERTEHLCMLEENRFVAKLSQVDAELADRLVEDLDTSRWQEAWSSTHWQRTGKLIRRLFTRSGAGGSRAESKLSAE